MRVLAVGRPEISALEMPARFKHDIAYFMTPAGERGAPPQMLPGEFWIDPNEATRWLDEGVLEVISPLDSGRHAEVEISEEHEQWLHWLLDNDIRHVRLES
jgi:hypothetical protein